MLALHLFGVHRLIADGACPVVHIRYCRTTSISTGTPTSHPSTSLSMTASFWFYCSRRMDLLLLYCRVPAFRCRRLSSVPRSAIGM
ncbi:hypothetical protein CEJ42_21260 [Herbaspirillum robiniae]|uniref:Uncharacterized protein n=1 Tax=Herbaspirillum robiniae TaxID=2014887 RepID=A0A246WLF2_9BURK|nr:hypothetical protein CEJ42_21260 [Herbaspirillum robiniae]